MMQMQSLDLLDRRALALLQLVDPLGRPYQGAAAIRALPLADDPNPRVQLLAKQQGRWAVLEAPGLHNHSASFNTPPSTPALRSVEIPLLIVPDDASVQPRKLMLLLPRSSAAGQIGSGNSVQDPVPVTLFASPASPIAATTAAVRVSVRKRTDGRRVAGALVRVRVDGEPFTAFGITDDQGEALVLFPAFPMSFTGSGTTPSAFIAGHVRAAADPAFSALIDDDRPSGGKAVLAPSQIPNPDDLIDRLSIPASGGADVQISTRSITTVSVECP